MQKASKWKYLYFIISAQSYATQVQIEKKGKKK